MSKAIAVAKPSIESVGAESHQPSPHATKSRKQKLIDAPRQSKHLPTRRPPSMIFSHGRLVSSRLSRRSHPDCRATHIITFDTESPCVGQALLDLAPEFSSFIAKLRCSRPEHTLLLRLQRVPPISFSQKARAISPRAPTVYAGASYG